MFCLGANTVNKLTSEKHAYQQPTYNYMACNNCCTNEVKKFEQCSRDVRQRRRLGYMLYNSVVILYRNFNFTVGLMLIIWLKTLKPHILGVQGHSR